MSEENEVIESEELDQNEGVELDENELVEEIDGDNDESADDDFADIDDEEAEEDLDDESDGEDENALQKEAPKKDADQSDTRPNAQKAAADEEPGEAEVLSQFSRDQIPGTDEYTDALIDQAKEFVKAKTGEEYDPFEPKHQALFTQACNKLDRIATEKFQEAYQTVKTQTNYQKAFKKASLEIDTILDSPELAEKFEAAIGELKQKDFKAIQDKAAKSGDFSGFIEIARRVKGVKAKVDDINARAAGTITKQAPEAIERNKPKKLANGVEFGGVANFLGL